MTRKVTQRVLIKEDIIKFLSEQPDDITIEEIMDFLSMKQKIIQGQRALGEREYYSHEETKGIIEKSFVEITRVIRASRSFAIK